MVLPAPGLLVADAGPLIVLAKCDQLPLLTALFSSLHVPQAVVQEVQEVFRGGDWPEIPRLRDFIAQATLHESIQDDWVADLRLDLHEGETQALALAKNLNALVLMDEAHGRRIAAKHAIAVIGTLGLLLRGKQKGLIPLVRPVMEQMRREGYMLGESLVGQVLALAGEL